MLKFMLKFILWEGSVVSVGRRIVDVLLGLNKSFEELVEI